MNCNSPATHTWSKWNYTCVLLLLISLTYPTQYCGLIVRHLSVWAKFWSLTHLGSILLPTYMHNTRIMGQTLYQYNYNSGWNKLLNYHGKLYNNKQWIIITWQKFNVSTYIGCLLLLFHHESLYHHSHVLSEIHQLILT